MGQHHPVFLGARRRLSAPGTVEPAQGSVDRLAAQILQDVPSAAPATQALTRRAGHGRVFEGFRDGQPCGPGRFGAPSHPWQ